MRILLTQATLYYPSYGGANKSIRLLLEALAAKGHQCTVVAGTVLSRHSRPEWQSTLAEKGIPVQSEIPAADVFQHNGVEVHTVWEGSALRHLWRQIRKFDPNWVLVASEDPQQALLAGALKECADRVLYLAYTTLALPFGPESGLVDESKTQLLHRCAGILAISEYVRDYVARWGGLESTVIPIQLYGSGPFPDYGRSDEGFVTLVNPCAYKGISIFVELARRLPEVQFAAVPTWGTTEDDLRTLASCPNITILEPVEDIDRILSRTRILLAPSLWAETFGRIVVEAMARGIPVMASNTGGLPEAKLGVDYVLPVNPIVRYGAPAANTLPAPEVPEQDLGPWMETLQRLVSDPTHYRELSAASRAVALSYIRGVTIEPLEAYLSDRAAAGKSS